MILFSRLLILALCGLVLTDVAYAGQKEDLEKLRKRISEMQREMDKTAESQSEVSDALRESERAISESNRKLAELAVQQDNADQKLHELQSQQQKLNDSIAGQQALLGRLFYQQYVDGKHEYPRLLLNSQDPNQAARNLQHYQYIARSRAAWVGALRDNLAELNALSLATLEKREELTSLLAQQAAQKTDLARQQLSRKQMLGKISDQLRKQRKEIGRLQRDENRLSNLVEKITKMLARPKSKSLLNNDKLPDNRFDGNPFAQLKGKLALPVKGEVTNSFGSSRKDSTVLWKGIFLRTSSGQAVKVVAAGQVVFADWLRGFGNLIIVDHGNDYMSLYGNNETLYKRVGDMLRGGDTIAAVGNSGGNEEFGLYFEIRHESKPLDPIKWAATK